MFSTTAVPNIDPALRPPAPEPAGRSWALSDAGAADGPPTVRVPVRLPLPVAQLPPPEPDPLVTTPPPASDLKLPASEWSTDDGYGAPTGRRHPRVGDTLLGFKLVAELGRGAFARVYLAHQEALASRPVALKVTHRPTREAERLARLQHTNVVPVYSVHSEGSVQVICMPFLGRTTIADLIRAYRVDLPSRHTTRKSTSARAGRTTALNSKSRSDPKSATDSKGQSGSHRAPVWTWSADGPPPIVGDPHEVLEVLSQLAAGLAHAHERGILHLDLKPANVLLADTGEPMLLDFNLSFDAARPDRELVGGTMPYMAIEQLLDMRDRGKGVIDARTDLYALGVMAFEMLTGNVPFVIAPGTIRDIDGMVAARRAGPPPLRPLNPEVTPAVEAIVRKLLAPEPADRYQSADDLRTDIARHLRDLPLKFAREASPRERFGKWRRRNPGVVLRLLAACMVGLTLGMGGVALRKAEANARSGAVERARETRAALDPTRLDLVLPDDPKARARGVQRATELLASYGLPGDPHWRNRDHVRLLSGSDRAALSGDLGELMFLLAHAKGQDAVARSGGERLVASREAWALNVAARACFEPDAVPPALERQAAVLAPAVGEEFAPAGGEPSNDPRHLFLDGAEAIVHGRYAAAVPLLDRAIGAQPSHAAAQFCLAYCRRQAGQFQRALERYDVARAMLPDDPRPAYHRGLIYGLNKKPALAEAEFTKALAIDPTHASAYRYRALARLELGTKEKLTGAEADFTEALKYGAPALFVHLVRERVRSARGDQTGAAADRGAIKALTPETEADFVVRGWHRLMTNDDAGAMADFERALALNPRSLVALENQVHILSDRQKNHAAALKLATRAVEAFPEFPPALAGRAVVLARMGRRAEAHTQIEKALLISDDAQVSYHAACVYALTSKDHADDRVKAFQLLRQSVRDTLRDENRELRGLATDPDLDAIRKDETFVRIQQGAAEFFKE